MRASLFRHTARDTARHAAPDTAHHAARDSARHPARQRAIIGLALLSLGFAVSIAGAAPQEETVRTVKVTWHDLDPSTPQDAQRLYYRIVAAAHAACGQDDIRDLKQHVKEQQCVEQAIDNAVTQVHSPALLAVRHHRANLADNGSPSEGRGQFLNGSPVKAAASPAISAPASRRPRE